MKKKFFLFLTPLVLIPLVFVTFEEITPPTILISSWTQNSNYETNIQGFQTAIQDFGINDVNYIKFDSSGDLSHLRQNLDYYDENDIDLVYSLTTPGTLEIKEYFDSTPVVFSIVTYPVTAELIQSFTSSENNLVGTSNFVPARSTFDIITKLVDVEKIGFVHREGEINSSIQYRDFFLEGELRDIDVVMIHGSNLSELKTSLENEIDNVDAFYAACDTLIQSGGGKFLSKFALGAKKPVFSCNYDDLEYGSLASVYADNYELGYGAGVKAALILNGYDPTQLESSYAEKFAIQINHDSAEKLGIDLDRVVSIVDQHSTNTGNGR